MLAQEQLKQIGTVAKESGVPIKTIRYYEELGLLQASGRTEGGFRLFKSDVLERLHFIKRAQSLGLNLSEIKEILQVYDQGELPCDRVKIKLEEKLAEIDEQIQQLLLLKSQLKQLLSSHKTIPPQTDQIICPIIELGAQQD
ncbi:MAG TPA: heavy metal-responsive transcriptional regulator [Cyanobacteria bacterium UBA11369]|nr:heavy metal-responsive transcriptional regulator [Cyanobacteria bacterium UBA11371]HBE35868.1 heavy metal-responsive transcriptional regulator [Cyanobacteria bacterium UBA11368]HBE50435.1 heavy metal-responsive transcriptional regulator [Cyanobacteria bacterium UBA11369]